MEYTRLGNSTLQVSKICLDSKNLSKDNADEIIKRALELGINFFETANFYNDGTNQEYLGHALKQYGEREKIRIALKLFDEEYGLSRKAIFGGINQSLKKLNVNYVDLLILPKWDYHTPIEETMGALYDMVKMGVVKQIGASDIYAYQFMKAQETARLRHWKTFVSMQSQYSVMYREDERELLKLLREENVSMTPYVSSILEKIAVFEKNKEIGIEMKVEQKMDEDYPILIRMNELAEKHDATMLQIALAWFFAKEGVTVPVIGIERTEELEEVATSVSIKLSPEEMQYLEEPYVPHRMLEVV